MIVGEAKLEEIISFSAIHLDVGMLVVIIQGLAFIETNQPQTWQRTFLFGHAQQNLVNS